MKIVVQRAIMIVAAAAVAAMAGLPGSTARADGKQLIKFSHKLHVQDNGMACTDCHTAVTESKDLRESLYPKMSVCETCHSDQVQSNCTMCHTSDDPSTYVDYAPTPVDLMFSHAYHVGKEQVQCTVCHQGIDAAETSEAMHAPTMATCTSCHNGAKAPGQCERCHTNLAALRPADHNKTDFIREHKWLARATTVTCTGCHTEASCEDCHAEVAVQRVDPDYRGLISPRSPRVWGIDRGQTQTLAKVHDLNFRYTHGVVAQAKTSDCSSCHDTQDFCARCHARGGDANQVGLRPATHDQPQFTMLGRGTGGGVHARLAKRDIESCAACHDASGADPVCVTCHVDVDGVKGTDPRTHPSGFMNAYPGEFHSDPGATCYVCHTDPNAHPDGIKGVGFCGYCHK